MGSMYFKSAYAKGQEDGHRAYLPALGGALGNMLAWQAGARGRNDVRPYLLGGGALGGALGASKEDAAPLIGSTLGGGLGGLAALNIAIPWLMGLPPGLGIPHIERILTTGVAGLGGALGSHAGANVAKLLARSAEILSEKQKHRSSNTKKEDRSK